MKVWNIDSLYNITDLVTDGKHGDCQNENNSGYYFISSKDVYNNKINYEDSRQITEKDFKETHRRTRLASGDIVLTNSGTIGRMALVKNNVETQRTTFQKSVAIIKPKHKIINNHFLYYYLQSTRKYLEELAGGTAQKNLLLGDMRKIKIPQPLLPIQRKIAAILSAYDDLIENNNCRIAILEKMTEELYRDWFVRLRFPGHEKAKIVKGMPEGWEIKRVCDLGRVVTGKTPPTSNRAYFDGQYPFIKTPDMHDNLFVIKTEETLTEDGIQYQKAQTLSPNSISVSCIGTGGVVAITSVTSQTNQQINSVILNEVHYREWVFFNLRNMKELIQLFGYTGSTMTNLSKGKFENLKFIMPPDVLLKEFHKMTEGMFDFVHILQTKSLSLTISRDRLLSRLMSGKIDTENMDIQFPASMQEELAHA